MPYLSSVILTAILAIAPSTYSTPQDTVATDTSDFADRSVANSAFTHPAPDHNAIKDSVKSESGFRKFISKVAHKVNAVTEFINGIDTTYVAEIDRDWKVSLSSDNWFEVYNMTLDHSLRTRMVSDVYSNVGFALSYKIFGVSYSKDITDFFHVTPMHHHRFETGFSTSRLTCELSATETTNGAYLRKLGRFRSRSRFSDYFSGVDMTTYTADALYFFNSKRYSHAAAYYYTRLQRRSAGSWVLGGALSIHNIALDYNELPADLVRYWPYRDAQNYFKFHYYNAAVTGGYAYNWVVGQHWLLNAMIMPGVGINICFEDTTDDCDNLISFNSKLTCAANYTLQDFYVSMIAKLHSNLYHARNVTFHNMIHNFSVVVGYRF